MVEMEMRVDHQVDARRVPVDRFEPGADLLARLKVDPEQPGEARAQPPGRVMLAIGVQPGIEHARPLGCSIRNTGIGTVTSPSPPSIRWANSPVNVPQVKA
jgi:hypothetical protein